MPSSSRPPSPSPAQDPLLALGMVLIAFACILWLTFMTYAVTDGFGISLYPASEHALLFLWGIALVSQSQLAWRSKAPTMSFSLASSRVLTIAAMATALLCVAAVISQSVTIRIITWLSLAIAIKMGFLTAASHRRQPLLLAALLCGWLGATVLALSYLLVPHAALLSIWGKILFFDGMPQLALLALMSSAINPLAATFAALAFIVSLALEGLQFYPAAFGLRSVVLAVLVAVGNWRSLTSPLSFWGGLIALSWIGGTASIAVWTHYMIHLKHFIYLGVYLTLAALVLSIPLRWPGAAKGPLLTRKRFNWVVGLVALGALTRATSYVSHSSYVRHLGYAAGIILVAIGLALPVYRKWRRSAQ